MTEYWTRSLYFAAMVLAWSVLLARESIRISSPALGLSFLSLIVLFSGQTVFPYFTFEVLPRALILLLLLLGLETLTAASRRVSLSWLLGIGIPFGIFAVEKLSQVLMIGLALGMLLVRAVVVKVWRVFWLLPMVLATLGFLLWLVGQDPLGYGAQLVSARLFLQAYEEALNPPVRMSWETCQKS